MEPLSRPQPLRGYDQPHTAQRGRALKQQDAERKRGTTPDTFPTPIPCPFSVKRNASASGELYRQGFLHARNRPEIQRNDRPVRGITLAAALKALPRQLPVPVEQRHAPPDAQIAPTEHVRTAQRKIMSISAVHTPMPLRAESFRINSSSGAWRRASRSRAPEATSRAIPCIYPTLR